MFRLRWAVTFAVYLSTAASQAQLVDVPQSKQLFDGVCVDTEGRETAPRIVGGHPDVDKGYLQKIPACQNQISCLSQDRLQYLERAGLMPLGLKNPEEYFKAAAPLAARMGCYEDQSNVEIKILELGDLLKKSNKLMPYETLLSTELTLNLARHGRDFIKDNRAAVAALADCYQLDSEYDQRADVKALADLKKRNSLKLQLYGKSEVRERTDGAVCEQLWNGSASLAGTYKLLKEWRQTLLALQLESGSGAKVKDFRESIARGQLPSSPEFQVLKPKDSVYLVPNPLYAGAPKTLEAATKEEMLGMGEFYKRLAAQFPKANMEEALLSNLNKLASEEPMLVHLDRSQPSSGEVAKAFKQYSKNMKSESIDDGLSDFQFYAYPKLVDLKIKEYPPEMRGDACAIAEYVHRRSHEIAELPATMLMDITTVAGLGGALNLPVLLKLSGAKAAKGAVARTGAFMNAGLVPGMALMADMAVTRGLSVKLEKEMCQSLQGDTGGMCRPEKISRDLIELQIQGAMMAALPVVMKATNALGASRAARASQAEAVMSAPSNRFRRHRGARKN